MKILISVLSLDQEPYITLENKIRETWLIDAKNAGIDVVFYYGSLDKISEGDRLFFPTGEGWSQINNKTYLMFKYIKENFDFDFVFRTNSSSYVKIENLINFLKDKPLKGYYSAMLGQRHEDIHFGSGCGYTLSRDLVEYIVDNETLWNFNLPDDVAVADILNNINISLSEGFRFECGDHHLEDPTLIDSEHYHYRCKVDNDRIKDAKLMDIIHNLKSIKAKPKPPENHDYEITYQKPHGTKWSVTIVFDEFYKIFSKEHNVKYITPINVHEPAGIHSPHIMTIRNKHTKKYVAISYWDRAEELLYKGLGWDTENLVGIITSAGVYNDMETIPFSYLAYSSEFDDLAKNRLPFSEKTNEELIFRGYLYGQRLDLSQLGVFNITDKKVFPNSNYYKELTESKICLSLNGAGEICNRDIEILAAGSVLFRPILNQKFYNSLIQDYHYIGFEIDLDPILQMNIIKNKYDEIIKNDELLDFVSNNGYNWYIENGSINANCNLLFKIFKDLDLINKLSF
jgi:hypothetical protein